MTLLREALHAVDEPHGVHFVRMQSAKPAVREEASRGSLRGASLYLWHIQDQANLQARRDLWRNCLIAGFPNVVKDPRGYGTGNKVRDLRKLCNRVSHMDSLLYVNVADLHDNALLSLLNSISHELRDWVDERSRVHEVLGRRPI